MKFKQYIALITGRDGLIPTPRFRWWIHKNERPTAREEAIAADIIEQANPRENITGHFPWGPEQQMRLQQLWIHPEKKIIEWHNIPIADAKELYTNVETKYGEMPVPNAVLKPEQVQGDFNERLGDILGSLDQEGE